MTGGEITDLIARLGSPGPGPAWREFLNQFSPIVNCIVRRYESDDRRVADCYLYVCEALSDDGFRRLRRFRSEGSARFPTWLAAVVANLCVDWRRKQLGRFRPLKAIAALSELEQLVYRYLFVRGMPRAECLHVLGGRFPDLTEQQIAEINARLFSLLTPPQRWQLSLRTASPIGDSSVDLDDAWQLEEPGPGPDENAALAQEREQLEAAMDRLPARQQLLLKLRFEQDLTLAEVARLAGLSDPFQAKRQIQAALDALTRLLKRMA
jgi:RNA polymerase sigma factor (sigma-70 family)